MPLCFYIYIYKSHEYSPLKAPQKEGKCDHDSTEHLHYKGCRQFTGKQSTCFVKRHSVDSPLSRACSLGCTQAVQRLSSSKHGGQWSIIIPDKRLYSSATSSHSHRSVSLPSRCFRVASWHKVAVFSDRGWWRGEFLAVTFSWEMIGPAPGAVSCEPGSGGESKTGQVFLKVERLASPAKSCKCPLRHEWRHRYPSNDEWQSSVNKPLRAHRCGSTFQIKVYGRGKERVSSSVFCFVWLV